jgi:hypothetical protein
VPANVILPFHSLFQRSLIELPTFVNQVIAGGLVFCFIYLSGQIILSLTNFFLDRVLEYRCHGYPYERLLLGDPRNKLFFDQYSRLYYRGTIFWLHWAALCAGFWFTLQHFTTTYRYFKWASCGSLGFFVLALVIHLIIQGIHKFLTYIAYDRTRTVFEKICLMYIKCYAVFYQFIANPLRAINKTSQPLPQEVIEKYKEYFKTDFQLDPLKSDSENYWFTLFYIRSRNPKLHDLISRWHQQSIFARNMVGSFTLAYLYALPFLFFERAALQAPHNLYILAFITLLFLLSVFFTIRFHYLFISYYSKCLFRAYVFLHVYKEPDSSQTETDIRKQSAQLAEYNG